MRASLASFLGIALALGAGGSAALAQQDSAEAPPALDVSIWVGALESNAVELLGRAEPGAISCGVSVQELGGHAFYIRGMGVALAPDATEHVTKEAAGLTFSFTARSSKHLRQVTAELVVSRGSRVVGRYRSSSVFPPAAAPSR